MINQYLYRSAMALFCAFVVPGCFMHVPKPIAQIALLPDSPQTDQLTKQAETLINKLSRGEFEQVYAQFNSKMKEAVSINTLKEVWQIPVEKLGSFVKVSTSRAVQESSYSVVLSLCEFERGPWGIRLVFDSQQEVAGLFYIDSKPLNAMARAENLIKILVRRDYANVVKWFDERMKASLTESKLADTMNRILSATGTFQQLVGVSFGAVGKSQIVIFTAQFQNEKKDIEVDFNDQEKVCGLWIRDPPAPASFSKPAYANPDAFVEKEVLVGSKPWELPGTLCLPSGPGPFPAVVLVHGSGPQDRDETISNNKPFRDLAWGLASQGVAVLRYDKRTYVYGSQMAHEKNLTVKEETIDDALLAVQLLRMVPKIDASSIFVLGHSLGGTLIPRIGQADQNIRGLIVLAGATRPLEDIILDQTRYMSNLDGSISAEEAAELERLERYVRNVKDPQLNENTPPEQMPLGLPAMYLLDLRAYHPAEVAASLSQPLLVLQGARDYQVTLDDFEGWKKMLSSRSSVSLKLYPKLNHLFQSGEGFGTPMEYDRAMNVEEEVVRDIIKWIMKNKNQSNIK